MSKHDDSRDNRNPDEIESEIKQTRSHLDETLNDLQQMIDPQSIMNNAYDYVRRGGANEFASNLGRTIKQNPVPTLLIGIGVGWLMFASNRDSKASRDSSRNLPVPVDQTANTSAMPGSGMSHEPSVTDPAGNSVADPSIVASPGTNEHVHTGTERKKDFLEPSSTRTGSERKDDFLEPSSTRSGSDPKR
ncbi:DUF3618 domain-containing protein [Halomonas sp. WWR20]